MNRVLLVDDNPERLETLAACLEGSRLSVRKARGGAMALKEAKRFNPTLILIAAEIENSSGLELFRRFVAEPATASIPVILLAPPEMEMDCLDEGAADCIRTPIVPEAAAARIKNQITLQNARTEREEMLTALKDRVSERTAELASLRKRLQLINDSKDLALRLIVRELSAPATGIAGIARVALLESSDGEKRERLSGLLNRNIETMDRLIANVEYLGTLRTGISVTKRAAVDMAPIVAMAVERETALFAEKRVETRLAFPGERAELPLHPELFAQMITPVLRLAAALSVPYSKLTVEAEAGSEWSSLTVAWSSSETNQGIVASVTDFGADILRTITGCGLITEICLAEKIARIYDGTVVWDLRDPDDATCTFQFDRSKAPSRKTPNDIPRTRIGP